MSITLHSIDKIVFWNKVYDEIEKIWKQQCKKWLIGWKGKS
jgi:hypothetical protein